jgi:hypothetical protein
MQERIRKPLIKTLGMLTVYSIYTLKISDICERKIISNYLLQIENGFSEATKRNKLEKKNMPSTTKFDKVHTVLIYLKKIG